MTKAKTMTTTLWKDLPYDVVADILSRLPVKTLMKLRCVCKLWYSIITHPNFITKHLNHASLYNKDANLQCFLQYLKVGFCRKQVFCLLYEQQKKDVREVELEIPFDSRYFGFSFVGSFNGLICLSYVLDFGLTIYLWNPSIRKSKTLSCSSTTLSPQLSYPQNEVVLGFGFSTIHSQTIEHKIVRILYCKDVNKQFILNSPPQAEVYTLSNESWRRIESPVPCFTSDRLSNAFINGSVHWVAARSVAEPFHRDMIMSFDIGDEVFGEMMLPNHFIDGVGRADLMLARLKESLSLCVCSENGNCYIWVMSEYGVADSWTKQFTIVLPRGRIEHALGFTKNNELLLETTNRKLSSYDLESLELKDLGIRGALSPSNVFPFMETLVLL